MTRRILASFATLFLVAGVALAGGPYFSDPITAAENDPGVQKELRRMEREGFVLFDQQAIPINYFVEPTGDYEWGVVKFSMMRPHEGDPTATDYCDLDAHIMVTDKGCHVDRIVMTQWTVW